MDYHLVEARYLGHVGAVGPGAVDPALEGAAAIVGEEKVEASAGDLLSLEGMDTETARLLATKGIHTTDDLAELAVDELIEMATMDVSRAEQLIMDARAPWFAQG